MKRLVAFTFALCIGLFTQAQIEEQMLGQLQDAPSVEVSTTTIKFQKENRPAYTAYINAEPAKVEKAWAAHMAEKCQCDFKKKKGTYEGIAIRLPEVTVETISVFSMIEEDEKGARLDVLVDMGVSWMNDKMNPAESAKMKAMVEGFVRNFYVGWYETVLKDQRKSLDKQTKAYDKVVKEGEKLAKGISKNTENITKAEEAIIKAEKDIVDLQAKMEELKGSIEQYKGEIASLEKQAAANTEAQAAEKVKVDAQNEVVEKLKKSADSLKGGQ